MTTLPSIFTANTYFWTPSSNASGRRRNEEKRQSEVAEFFKSIGFEVNHIGDKVIATHGDIEAVFEYRETCGHVYKSLCVTRNGKRSNVSAIKKLLK